MSSSINIQDDFGNSIPLLDRYGNLSVQVMMLYAEDKLTEEDRIRVDQYAATDEMSRDALDGYCVSKNPVSTRQFLSKVQEEVELRSGAAAIRMQTDSEAPFNYRKLAAALALLIVIGGGTFWASQFFNKNELAENKHTESAQESFAAPEENEAELDNNLSDTENHVEESVNSAQPAELREQKQLVDEVRKPSTSVGDEAGTTPSGANVKKAAAEKPVPVKESPTDLKNEDQSAKAAVTSGSAQVVEQSAKQASENQRAAQKDEAKRDAGVLAKDKDAETRQVAQRMREQESTSKPTANYDMQSDMAEPASETVTESNSDRAAKFPGGDVAMYKFIEKRKNYTDALKAQNVAGVIAVSFDIEPDGRVSNAKIKSGENGILREDALRVVRSMPNWKPARNAQGEPIKYSKTVNVKYGD